MTYLNYWNMHVFIPLEECTYVKNECMRRSNNYYKSQSDFDYVMENGDFH